MTLRGRLTAAFLVVVLGPVLLGAFFAGSTVTALDRSRATERLGLAAAAARTSVDALCQQLRAAADAVALHADAAARATAAGQVVGRGLAAAVVIADVTGATTYATPAAPPTPWRDCAAGRSAVGPVRALTARVDLRDPAGTALGTVAAAQAVDPAFVARLAGVTGAAVTLLDGAPARLAQTTEAAGVREAVLAAASQAHGETVTQTADGRYVRRTGPADGQPLPLVLSVPGERPSGLYAALAGAVLVAALLAVLAAGRLARVTTRPLMELAGAVDRVARGDLTARVPVRSRDEIGRLAGAFNRMARETGTYVAALTSSRDQLRGHLAVLGDTLASTHDLERILRVILHSAIAATGARAGAVLLLDGEGVLVGQCAEGLVGRCRDVEPAALRVPVGVGVVGAVAATGVPQRGRVDPSGAPTGEPRCETYIAVPFAAPGVGDPTGRGGADPVGRPGAEAAAAGAALGVLALYDRVGADEFDDDDLVTLRTFAGHAAVAVENVRVHEEAQRLSLTDPLTGLWNYRYLRESIRREVERASRFGRMLSVLALDLDRFKDVNDTWGHTAGDTVLAEFARRVRGEIREVDLAFRQGGEEFVLLLPETDARGASIVAERLGAVVRDSSIPVDGHGGTPVPVGVTVSIGIAVYPDHATTGQRVLDAADDALYAAKAAGRDTWRLAEPRPRPANDEITVPAAATSPTDGLPRAGTPDPEAARPDAARAGPGGAAPAPGGASSGPHPPRQSRGR
ncbi:GGDEF domain-containing protein [Micromonospora mirobrigensis]|uniref:Diguanylate cyclase (GGDEF) domain-containing protein n=1 Tax=Micromonospora mirobrigensis TaxID=262898 RepID=A0A1C4UXK1_9ACTN|nr:GGDEF domain-containing protein [Micromonospora mirobrigensis]SCE76414.1 diguanylate cyclase (GGDEF) domain-containing protein [Micromonospora mirobrigensis]